ncbi:MAG: CAP domain-containing protein, partial [Bacteroidia bacterium]
MMGFLSRLSFLFLFVCVAFSGFSQKKGKIVSVNDENFNLDSLPHHILRELNRFRAEKGLDYLEFNNMMNQAADISAQKMAGSGKNKVEPDDTKSNLQSVGCTRRGEEVTMKAPISKGRESYKTADVCKVICEKWETNPKFKLVLENPKYTLVGIVCAVDEKGKKTFVSAVFGGFDITNDGADHRKEMNLRYNKKSKKLDDYAARKCKNCERWRNYDILHKGLKIEPDGKIYLEYNNSRELRRLLKKSSDGLAVDIVQKEQYTKSPDYNIVDNNLY